MVSSVNFFLSRFYFVSVMYAFFLMPGFTRARGGVHDRLV